MCAKVPLCGGLCQHAGPHGAPPVGVLRVFSPGGNHAPSLAAADDALENHVGPDVGCVSLLCVPSSGAAGPSLDCPPQQLPWSVFPAAELKGFRFSMSWLFKNFLFLSNYCSGCKQELTVVSSCSAGAPGAERLSCSLWGVLMPLPLFNDIVCHCTIDLLGVSAGSEHVS